MRAGCPKKLWCDKEPVVLSRTHRSMSRAWGPLYHAAKAQPRSFSDSSSLTALSFLQRTEAWNNGVKSKGVDDSDCRNSVKYRVGGVAQRARETRERKD